MPRLLSPDVLADPLDHAPLPPDDVVAGSPTAAVLALDTVGGVEVGVWEMSEGTARDTEVDEVFVVVSGAGTSTSRTASGSTSPLAWPCGSAPAIAPCGP